MEDCVVTEASVNSNTKSCETSPTCEPSGKIEDWSHEPIKNENGEVNHVYIRV